jgi:hypothetical protein
MLLVAHTLQNSTASKLNDDYKKSFEDFIKESRIVKRRPFFAITGGTQ